MLVTGNVFADDHGNLVSYLMLFFCGRASFALSAVFFYTQVVAYVSLPIKRSLHSRDNLRVQHLDHEPEFAHERDVILVVFF